MKNSKIFNTIRNMFRLEKPLSLPYKRNAWKIWRAELREKRPVAYFFTEWIPRTIEKLDSSMDNMTGYLKNRFVKKTHLIETGLPVGGTHNFSDKIVSGAFEEFCKKMDKSSPVEFQYERELCELYVWWKEHSQKKKIAHEEFSKIVKKERLNSDSAEYRRLVSERSRQVKEMLDMETEMLVKLIQLRHLV